MLVVVRPSTLYTPGILIVPPEKRREIYRKFGLVGCQICYTFAEVFNGVRLGSRDGIQASINRRKLSYTGNRTAIPWLSNMVIIPTVHCVLLIYQQQKIAPPHFILTLKNEAQSVPRCKHFSSGLQKRISLCCKWHKSLFVLR